jgi:hypothetical protein
VHRKLEPVGSPFPFPFSNLKVGMKPEKKGNQKGRLKEKHKWNQFLRFILPFSFDFPLPIAKILFFIKVREILPCQGLFHVEYSVSYFRLLMT